jgi:outer membrane protein OmpA-like peptidoglycan-associated protein
LQPKSRAVPGNVYIKHLKLKHMSFNLIDAAKGLFTNELVGKASAFLGESESGVGKAVSGIVPTVLSGLMNKAGSHEGAGSIANMVTEQTNGGVLNSLGSFFGNDGGGLLNKGAGLLSGLFGSKTDGITSLISNFAGIKSSSSSSLLSMALPALLGLIGKHSSGGASGIASLFSSQKDNIAAAVPSGLNLSSVLGNLGGNARAAATHATEEVAEKSGGAMKILLPLLLLGALGAGIFYLTKGGCGKKAEEAVAAVTEDTSKKTTVVETVVNTVKESFKVKLANGVEIDAYKGGIEDKLVTFLNGDYKALGVDSLKKIWFDFDNLNFNTGSAVLTAESQKQVDNMTAILKAYPAVKLKIGGYTDKVGNEAANVKLSGARATAVKEALGKAGVGTQVDGAEGYGSKFAVYAADAPEADRVKDRHVSVSVRM